MQRIYLDHASATPVSPQAISAMAPFWSEAFANPSSIHSDGIRAKEAMNHARTQIAHHLGILSDEVIFTGSATESCNLALEGSVLAWKRDHPDLTPHIIVSAIEHDAVLAAATALSSSGVRVSRLPVDEEGIVRTDKLAALITTETVLVSVMLANNEIGTIQPVNEVAHVIRQWKKEHRGVTRDVRATGDQIYPLLHSDACQATNYVAISVPKLGVDLLTINSAKIYGPKGVALLVRKRHVPLSARSHGGHQEGGYRAGTEAVPLIVGFASALNEAMQFREQESLRLSPLRDALARGLTAYPGVVLNGHTSTRLPNNVHVSVAGVEHEFLALLLDGRGISVSTKSACNERDAEESHVLLALATHASKAEASGLRFSLGRGTTQADIEETLRVFADVLPIAIAGNTAAIAGNTAKA